MTSRPELPSGCAGDCASCPSVPSSVPAISAGRLVLGALWVFVLPLICAALSAGLLAEDAGQQLVAGSAGLFGGMGLAALGLRLTRRVGRAGNEPAEERPGR